MHLHVNQCYAVKSAVATALVQTANRLELVWLIDFLISGVNNQMLHHHNIVHGIRFMF